MRYSGSSRIFCLIRSVMMRRTSGFAEAELGAVGGALAVEQAVVFRVVLEELLGRHERVERVDRPVAFEAAGLLAVAHGAVDAVARGPDRVEGFVIEIVADADAGLLGVVEAR